MRSVLALAAALTLAAVLAPAALAGPVATSDDQYSVYGRVFPDPLGGCQLLGTSPCDPNAEGNIKATTFIGVNEFRDALAYMNTKAEWQRYMEVLILDGKDGAGSHTKAEVAADPKVMFPGDTLPPEFTPKAENVSAGLPQSDLSRAKSDLTVVRVTDETVPDAGKKRMTLSLSIHGIERAGAEGGTRAMEDLVTAATSNKLDTRIVPDGVRKDAPTFKDVLQHTIIYFTYPNPDGWRRGSYDTGVSPFTGLPSSFQRYNGNGIDPNRDYTDIGYNFRGYSGGSEPETRAFKGFYSDLLGAGDTFQAGDDLHGQPEADALSYTLLPHGSHDLAKDTRIRETAKHINRAQYLATRWSPIIKDNDPVSVAQDVPDGCVPTGAAGTVCPQIYAQTWGSVYDTINYTTTGATGDYFDSPVGLNADGIDNEMSFSHIDKQIVFEPNTEQLHVAGNKAIIFTHLADILNPVTSEFLAPGAEGYVPNVRVQRAQQQAQGGAPAGTSPQPDLAPTNVAPDPGDAPLLRAIYPFTVQRSPTIFDGGMRIDVTQLNANGVGNPTATLQIQCRPCDDGHAGSADSDGWVTIASDYNQSPIYAQAGLTAAVNYPDANYTDTAGKVKPVEWRAVVDNNGFTGGPVSITIDYTSAPASDDGNSAGDPAPVNRAYDVANTDFFEDLNKYIADPAKRFAKVDPHKVIAGTESINGLKNLVLADDLLPGYTGGYGPVVAAPGPPTADIAFTGSGTKTAAPGPTGCLRSASSVDDKDFTIAPGDGNASMTVNVSWTSDPVTDYDVYVERKVGGTYTDVDSAATGDNPEIVTIPNPAAGDWRVEVCYYATLPTSPVFSGTVKFTALAPAAGGATGSYTVAEKNAWVAKLREYVAQGGNLVLTDGALRGMVDLVPALGAGAVDRQTVYTGQMTLTRCATYANDGTCATTASTLDDPINKRPGGADFAGDINQPGSRYNTGMRRQTYEPTALGFAIQDASGGDASNAVQYDIASKPFTDAGGRVSATSVDNGTRATAVETNRVTFGEIKPATTDAGQIRIAGALLPQPTEKYDHPLGLSP
ncbi:MAG: hypothetical protein QOF76_3620, partial [Solirubrobacteraceae bacterium]|nr:hypothetical protein [Solirubrobacteraceae bacterium]